MKAAVLQAAMQGKLTEQLETDSSVDDLLEDIKKEREKLVAEGKIKKSRTKQNDNFVQLSDDEMPFERPDNWRWVRFGDISTYGNSLSKISPEKIKPDMWCLDLEDIEKGTGTVIQKVYAKDRKIDGDKTLFVSGQILYSKLRPYLLKVLIADEDGICTPELVPFSVFT